MILYNVFFEKCKNILPLWNALSARLYEKCSHKVRFNICNIIFGEYFNVLIREEIFKQNNFIHLAI